MDAVVEADPVVSQEDPGSIPSSEIRAQLERILTSPDFDVPERAHKFLRYVVTKSLSGRANRIKAYTIAVEVFGRSGTFDPQSDPVVRIEAGRVRRGLERYYLTAGSSDPTLITIPKGSYVPAFSRRTEEGRPDSVGPSSLSPRQVSPPKGRLWIPLLALSALAAIVLILTTWAALHWFVLPRTVEAPSPGLDARGPNIPKLLVEPFQDMTGTAEGATIAMGLTEEVVGKLVSFKDLVVVRLDPRRPDSAALAARTDSAMRYTLAGSVRLEGDAIRLSAHLIDRTNGSILWANNYDGSRRVGRLLDMEADIAGDVATALGQPYGIIFKADAARASHGPPEEWDAYACTLAYCLTAWSSISRHTRP